MLGVVTVVQARLSSQRLPGKVLEALPAADDPTLTVLDWTVRRAAAAPSVAEVVVATSDTGSDDRLAEHCDAQGYRCVRGSLDDVLDRFHDAVLASGAEHVVRLTADCPFVDPDVVELVVGRHLQRGGDFTANRLPPPAHRTWPIGLDVEVVTAAALERAWNEAHAKHQREHVLPYLYEEPGRFDVAVVDAPIDAGDVRWTVDTPQDLDAVRALVRAAGAGLGTGWRELLDAWRAHPELADLNSGVTQRTGQDVDPRTP